MGQSIWRCMEPFVLQLQQQLPQPWTGAGAGVQADADILERAEHIEDPGRLETTGDSESSYGVRRQPVGIRAQDAYCAGIRCNQSGQGIEQGGFSRAVGPYNSMYGPPVY